MMTGTRDAARIDFNEAIRLDSKTREFYLHRGLCLRALGREEDAKKDYEELLSIVVA